MDCFVCSGAIDQEYIIYFVTQIDPALAIENFSWSLCPFRITSSFCVLNSTLVAGTTSCYSFSYIFYALVLKQVFYSRVVISSIGEWY